jgi:hypothetical protein
VTNRVRHRHRIEVIAGVALALALVNAGTACTAGPDGTPEVLPAPSVHQSTPASAAATLNSIPDSAFLQMADTHSTSAARTETSDMMLPPLCGATFPVVSPPLVRRAMAMPYHAAEPTDSEIPAGQFVETIAVYDADGAAQFMVELREMILRCTSQRLDDRVYTNRLLVPTARGDGSLLIEVRYAGLTQDGAPTGMDETRLVSVVRAGDMVMILYEIGWEGSSSSAADVEHFTSVALARMHHWRR